MTITSGEGRYEHLGTYGGPAPIGTGPPGVGARPTPVCSGSGSAAPRGPPGAVVEQARGAGVAVRLGARVEVVRADGPEQVAVADELEQADRASRADRAGIAAA